MNRNDFQWMKEEEWLEEVLQEAKRQFDKNKILKDKIREDAIRTQKQLWEDVGSVSIANGLDQIADFMQFISFMKMHKLSHESTRKFQEKYERILSSPYFGRMDFIEEGEERVEKCYIGVSNLINDNLDFLIYDWRAPISSMFYDYEIEASNYKCLEGIIKGEITLKRQYKIQDGEIKYMFDSNLKIDDEMLQDILSKSTDNKMKSIVTTIQREQNKVIRNDEYKTLIVQGPAGSGKTSVALHRIAYLLYKHRDTITTDNIVVFSPNEIFNDYISNVLPELGEENMHQTTFKEYMHSAIGGGFIKENYSEMMEYILSSRSHRNYIKRTSSIKYKSTMAFVELLKHYVAYIENKNRDFKDIVFKDQFIVSSKELQELFFKDYKRLPLKRRLRKLKDRIIFLLAPYKKARIEEVIGELEYTGNYVDRKEILEDSITLVRDEMKEIYIQINEMTEFNLMNIYREFFENLESLQDSMKMSYSKEEIEIIKDYALENIEFGKLNYEDQIILLYLKIVLGDISKTAEIKHIIIDEAQDYIPLQYEIFYQIFENANMTILGDLNQSINPLMNVGDYKNILNIFTNGSSSLINLTKSYRSTKEITEFSNKILHGEIINEGIQRNGEEPLVLGFSSEGNIEKRLLEDIHKYKEKGYQSIGIITRTVKEAKSVYGFLKNKIHIKAIIKDNDEYVNDTVVIPAYLSKGLEFDVVLIYNAGNGNYSHEDERLLLYTACTRALHVLNIYYSGESSPLLKNE